MGRFFLVALGCIFLSDGLFFFSVYNVLPDTSKLLTGVELERVGSDKRSFKFMTGPKNKKYLPLKDISLALQQAVIGLEDARFYQHSGFDWDEVEKAILKKWKTGKRLRGASTISQQLVKNIYLNPSRTFRRKILEALITVKLEMTLPKKKIIEVYLNSIDWGKGLLGISDAAHYYFRKRAKDLNVKEAAFLAAIIPNPTRFGKMQSNQLPKKFVRRQMFKAFEHLYQSGVISIEQYQRALYEPFDLGDRF